MKKILFFLLIFFGLAVVIVAINYTFLSPDLSLTLRLIFFFLLLIDALCFFVVAWGLIKNTRWLYWPTVALFAINALAAIFDDFGLVDALALSINIFLLLLFFMCSNKDIFKKKEMKK